MSKLRETKGQKLFNVIEKNAVPILFIIICAIGIPFSGYSLNYLGQEIITRIGRNSFLIIALLIPIMAGMG
ncbi:MAG: ABC transporter permease, partial [Sphaerochaetaceae bacterium]|nr:ABC transporter permease [Sphaerochaetaceae bacterium]